MPAVQEAHMTHATNDPNRSTNGSKSRGAGWLLLGLLLGLVVAVLVAGGYIIGTRKAATAHPQALGGDVVPSGLAVASVADLPVGGRGGVDGVIGDDYPWPNDAQDSHLDPWK